MRRIRFSIAAGLVAALAIACAGARADDRDDGPAPPSKKDLSAYGGSNNHIPKMLPNNAPHAPGAGAKGGAGAPLDSGGVHVWVLEAPE